MTDITINPNNDLKEAILYMEKALNAFKKGLHMIPAAEAEEPAQEQKPARAQKAAAKVEKTQEAPVAKAEETKAEPDTGIKDAPTLEEIRKVFAKIMLDEAVQGKSVIKAALDKYKVKKISDLSPDFYLGIMQDAISDYKARLEKQDPKNADEKLQEMVEWIIPF